MPLYRFKCDECGYIQDLYGSMSKPPKANICDCGLPMYRVFGARAQVFKPFKTDQITGEMIEINTAKERDKILAEYKLTMDPVRYVRRRKPIPSANTITFKDVKETIESGRAEGTAKEIEGLPFPESNI